MAGPTAGSWNEAVGLTFEATGRMWVWERGGRVWIKDTNDLGFSLLLDIREEVGNWGDLGFLGFAVDPAFRVNGHIYLLYVVDRHHLLHFGAPSYNPSQNEYDAATIGRLTRYTCTVASGFRSVDPASRTILIGETRQTGIPLCTDSHSVGSLVFGEDGTLLVSTGDGASAWAVDTGGAQTMSFAPQALADGIIRPKENIGAFRAQLVDCLNGKILRIDPATGNGVSSNPYYDAANPRAARSRVWALGLRNPFRMSLRPESGSHNPADGNPGVLAIGDVGWNTKECLRVATGPGQNLGWPLYEGLDRSSAYDVAVANLDAPNPLYPVSGCAQYFSFRDLLKEDTLAAAGQPPFVNPCNVAQRIPNSIPQFLQRRPVLDWDHGGAITHTPTYGTSGQALTVNVGSPNSPVSGSAFQGNCAVGGAYYTAGAFPAQYQGRYYFADWGQGVIKTLTFDASNNPVALGSFAGGAGAVVSIVAHPFDGSLYYVSYTFGDAGTIRKLAYTGNRTPVPVAAADLLYGPSPLAVQFSSGGSADPDGQPLTYSWNFGDGSAASTQPNPAHTFSAPPGVPTKFTVTLTVTDSLGLSAQTNLTVSANNTPPAVAITSPAGGALYSMWAPTTFGLTAEVTDAESNQDQLAYRWQTLLHHNEHDHIIATDTNQASSVVVSPVGCDGINIYYYRVLLTVTDPAGLSTVREVAVHPDCNSPNTAPAVSDLADRTVAQGGATGPIPFTVGDAETAAANLQVTGGSSNPVLVPAGGIVFGGSGSNRTLTVSPDLNQSGTAIITVMVSDGQLIASDAFLLTVTPSTTLTGSYSNLTSITIPGAGNSAPYPSTISVGGLAGVVSGLTVTLGSMSHTYPADVDVLLVGPSGHKAMILSDVGGGADINSVNLTLSDSAATALTAAGQIVSGTYKPSDVEPGETGDLDSFPAPAPPGPYGSVLSAFYGQPANGVWSLYVVDDGPGDQGTIGRWSLNITSVSNGPQAPTISDIGNQTTTIGTATPAIAVTVNDTDTPISSLSLSGSSSNPGLVPQANIVFGGAGSSRTVTLTPAAGQTGAATITVTVTDGALTASDTFVLTVTGVNTAPTISDLADQNTTLNTTTGPIGFTVGDAETAAGSLTVSGSSSNPTLVPSGNVVFGGTGASRTVTVTPAANQSGVTTITVTVSDGALTSVDTFVLTVSAAPSGLVAAYGFNEGLGTTVTDVSGSGNNGAIGTATWTTAGRYGGALSFNGSSARVTVSDANTLDLTSGMTLEAWVYPTTVGGWRDVIYKGPDDIYFLMGSSANSTPAVGGTFSGPLGGTGSLPLNTWTHLAGTYDGATLRLYVNGLQAASQAQSGLIQTSTGALTIGGDALYGQYFAGRIDEVRIYSRALSLAEIQADMNSPVNAAPNTAPTISDIANQVINEDTATAPIAFAVGDAQTTPASLMVSGNSSNPALVPNGNIVLGGSGANRTVTVTPAGNAAGSATITLTVSDGALTASDSFVVTVNAVNDPPTISDILDRAVPSGTVLGPIGFTVGDVETAASSLSLAAGSSNPVLVPDANITFGGAGSNRTLTVTVAPGQVGTATITVTVGDGTVTASDAFLVSASAGNTAPTLSSLGDQVIDEDGATGPLAFTVGDAETAAGSLTVSAASSDLALVPLGSILLGGSGANRTVTVTPLGNAAGSSTITLTVSDGMLTASDSFVLTVNAVNDAPTISNLPDQSSPGTAVGPVPFTVGDVETAPGDLTLSGSSSNPGLVPNANIVFGGAGSSRTVTVTPVAGQNGTATILMAVSDGVLLATDTFLLTVSGLPAGTRAFTNATATLIPGVGNATPYPSTINVSGLGGVISNLTVALRTMSHTYPADVDVLLVGPSGRTAMLCSDVGGGGDINNITLTFSDAAAAALTAGGPLSSGTYRPSDVEPGETGELDTFSAPAPPGPYSSALSVFNGQGANGVWSLYVVDDGPGDQGTIGSWTLDFTTVSIGPQTPTLSDIADQTTTMDTATAAIAFLVNDADTPAASLTLSGSSANPVLVPDGSIVFGGSGSNRTVVVTPAAGQTGTAAVTVTVSDGVLSASDGFLLTVTGPNTAPTISTIADQTIAEDGGTGVLAFTVGDGQTAAGSLTVSGSSSDPALVPPGNIVFGGSGPNRTVTVSPAANQNGSATITVTVSDGVLTAGTSFGVTVNALNDAPTISNLTDQSSSVGVAIGPLSFSVGDVETAAGSLTLSGNSSNPALVPDGNIAFGGAGTSRSVTVTPVAGQSGTATISITVSDGSLTASDTFVLTVSALFTGTKAFTNTTVLVIPSQGRSTPYPSTMNVTGMGGVLASVTVSLRGLTHSYPDDLDLLLVAPFGSKVLIFSDAGGGSDVNGLTVGFSDSAPASLPNSSPIVAGTFKPTNYGVNDAFPGPAPAGPYAATLATFNGQSANGTWALYVNDDGSGDAGSLGGGWSLTLTTSAIAGALAGEGIRDPAGGGILARLSIALQPEADKVILRIEGEPAEKYTVEGSADLLHWEVLGVVYAELGVSYVEDPYVGNHKRRFYRVQHNP